MGANIKEIGAVAFYDCDNLTNVYYKGTLEQWYSIDFANPISNSMHYAKHLYLLDQNNEWYEVIDIEK